MHETRPHYRGLSPHPSTDGRLWAACALTPIEVAEVACTPDCKWLQATVRGVPLSSPPAAVAGSFRVTGPEICAELDGLTRDFYGDLAPFQAFIGRLPALLAGMGCTCWPDFAVYLYHHPPEYESAEALQRWTWEAHNAVNVKLGRPAWTWEAARGRWGRSRDSN